MELKLRVLSPRLEPVSETVSSLLDFLRVRLPIGVMADDKSDLEVCNALLVFTLVWRALIVFGWGLSINAI